MVVISLSRAVRIASVGGGCGEWSTATTPAPISAAIVCKATTKYVRKRVGSLSPLSSDSQATCRPQRATHALTSVVFPNPAGAAMRVSLRCSRAIRRGRGTAFGRGGGIYSFVANSGVDIDRYLDCSLTPINSSATIVDATAKSLLRRNQW